MLSPSENTYPLTSPLSEATLPSGFSTLHCKSAPQFSIATLGVKLPVGLAHSHTPASVLIVTSCGHPIIGSCTSITSISNVHSEVFILPSVAIYVTVYNPTSNISPGAGPAVCATLTSQLSVAIGMLQFTPPSQLLKSLPTVIVSAGQFTNTGFSLSSTTTVIAQVAVLPLSSVTVHTTGVLPTGKTALARLLVAL